MPLSCAVKNLLVCSVVTLQLLSVAYAGRWVDNVAVRDPECLTQAVLDRTEDEPPQKPGFVQETLGGFFAYSISVPALTTAGGYSATGAVEELAADSVEYRDKQVYRYVCRSYVHLSQSIARGEGEPHGVLAKLLEIPETTRSAYYAELRVQFESIFIDPQTASMRIIEIARDFRR